VAKKIRQARREREQGLNTRSRQTVAVYLESWLAGPLKKSVARTTHVRPDLRTDRDGVLRGSGLFCFGSIRAASLVTRRFRSEVTAVRSNKVTLIWGILTLISLLVVLVLVVLGVVSL